jgi:16S rRNA U516 pseudouridylate synthase RsuA-like enzyme
VLAAAGVDSRRSCEKLIEQGKVSINGKVIKDVPYHVKPGRDKILVNGVGIQPVQKTRYFMVHKPKGYVCSSVQQNGVAAKPVVSLLDKWFKEWRIGKPVGAAEPRLFTVGRLDVNTTGLLLLTNDGVWAQQVSHPKAGARQS